MIKNMLIRMITIYQKIPGPWHGYCKHIPSCSSYMKDAIYEYGTVKGGIMGIKRILKCNPFNKNVGYDPVVKKEKK